MWRLNVKEDRGAVAITFALVLVVLLGFVGLGVDVASAFAKKQEMQNGADAAALAAAQECATVGCGSAAGVAQTYADGNVRRDSVGAAVSFPAGNQVRVTAEGPSPNNFLPVVGVNSFDVEAAATAVWGSPTAGPVIPLTISACSFFDQLGTPQIGDIVEMWVPKNDSGPAPAPCDWHADYPPGGFGWLDGGDDCTVDVTVGMWAPGKPGLSPPACDLSGYLGQTILIPIFDDDRGTGSGAEVHIMRFAAVKLLGLEYQQGKPDDFGEKCGSKPGKDFFKTCLRGQFVGFVSSGDGFTLGPPGTEIVIVELID